MDLRIEKGIRKPSYRTHCNDRGAMFSFEDKGRADDERDHNAPVVQIEALDRVGGKGGGATQVLSLDSVGLLIIWITVAASLADATTSASPFASSSDTDFGVCASSKVSLAKTRVLHLGGTNGFDRYPAARCLSPLAFDSSSVLVSGPRGKLLKVARLGNPSAPIGFSRPTTLVEVADSDASLYFSDLTCLATSCIDVTKQKYLILAGRVDASLDLFATDCNTSLRSWSLSTAKGGKQSSGKYTP